MSNKQSTKERMINLIEQCCLMRNGEKPNEVQNAIWYDCLRGHTAHDIETAFKLVMKNTTGRLTPGLVVKYLPNISGHPGVEEAFNHLVSTINHHGYLTDEIRESWGACSDHLERGDKVAARMGFKEKYQDLINIAGQPKWTWYQSGSIEYDQIEREKKYMLGRLSEKGWISKQEAEERLSIISGSSEQNLISQEKQKENVLKVKNLIANGLSETKIA